MNHVKIILVNVFQFLIDYLKILKNGEENFLKMVDFYEN